MNKIKNLVFILIIATGLSVCAQQIPARTTLTSNLQQSTQQAYSSVSPLDIVARPSFYLNKNVKIKAKFDKFSTLGLDYQPAMKSSEKYISFLIQRPDVTDHNIPLSELKLFLDRNEAEKYIELNSGDIVEFSGKVFSTALGDPWVEVTNFNVISTKSKTETK
jgi:hypothetical protein